MSLQHEAIDKAKGKMEKTISALVSELSSIRAGRANPQLLNRVMVDYYGTMTPIPQVGNVASPEPRLLTISLWDQSMMKPVEKAILASDLGLTPTNDGKVIRLLFPEPTEERRKELVKMRDEDPNCEVVCHFCHSKYQYDLNDLLAEYDAQAAENK